jgi:hypothetical protein
MENLNKTFWNKYYKTTNDDIKKESSFASFIYSNYIFKYNDDNIYLKICDLGSGNCRDTIYFNYKGNLCYGVDINGILNKENNNCKLIKKDVEKVLKNYELKTLFDIIYMRWFLHAMPYNISNSIFINAVHNLKPNGIICIEVRSLNDKELKKNSIYDENDKSYITTHKRWLYSIDICKELASKNNCDILYCEEGYFSPNKNTETSNPLLIRFICRKKLLPYYQNSENYIKYKHIIPKIKQSTLSSYNNINIMNKILEKNKIKYIAVDRTLLGLNRHGGIIPWDNEIYIGFIEDNWEKLFSIKDELQKNGLKCKINGENHCNFNSINCFKLIRKNNFYEGLYSTYCSVNEYNNVVKQIFGYSYIYAPFCNHNSLTKKYGEKYFINENINDNFYLKNLNVKNFSLNYNDLSYQLE